MEAPRLERKLVAILAADVEGYSRHMERDEEATLATLSSHRLVVDELIASFGGRITGTAGDSAVAEFASIVDASTARSESRRSWPRPTRKSRPTSGCSSASASMSAT